jgi:hypothetical protein
MFGDVTCCRFVLPTPHVILFFCLCGVTALQYAADFLFAGYNPILVEAKLIFFKYIYRQDVESRKLAWWQEKGKGYGIQEQTGWLLVFRKLKFKFQLASIFVVAF